VTIGGGGGHDEGTGVGVYLRVREKGTHIQQTIKQPDF
jgi:hypothetical protein